MGFGLGRFGVIVSGLIALVIALRILSVFIVAILPVNWLAVFLGVGLVCGVLGTAYFVLIALWGLFFGL